MGHPTVCRTTNRRILFQSLSRSRFRTSPIHLFAPLYPLRASYQPQTRHESTRSEPRRIGDFQDVGVENFNEPVRNPMDKINNHRREMAERAYRIRRMKFAGIGIVVCVLAQLGIIWMIPDPSVLKKAPKEDEEQKAAESAEGWLPRSKAEVSEKVNEEFQGKPVVVGAGGKKLLAHDEISGEDIELISTGTSSIPHFPKKIKIPLSTSEGGPMGNEEDDEYTLLGLGIRTVSFLSIQVYVVGFYVHSSSLAALQSHLIHTINPTASALIPGEKEQLKLALLDAEKSYKVWDDVLREKGSNLKTAFRIVPTRNTDFGHLRDGWVRGITSRAQSAQQKGDSSFQDESFGSSMRDFKSLLAGKGKAPTGSIVLLTRDGEGALGVLFQSADGKLEDFGKLNDERIARLVWLGYLGGKTVSSESARKGVVDGIMELVERPIGSVETKVS